MRSPSTPQPAPEIDKSQSDIKELFSNPEAAEKALKGGDPFVESVTDGVLVLFEVEDPKGDVNRDTESELQATRLDEMLTSLKTTVESFNGEITMISQLYLAVFKSPPSQIGTSKLDLLQTSLKCISKLHADLSSYSFKSSLAFGDIQTSFIGVLETHIEKLIHSEILTTLSDHLSELTQSETSIENESWTYLQQSYPTLKPRSIADGSAIAISLSEIAPEEEPPAPRESIIPGIVLTEEWQTSPKSVELLAKPQSTFLFMEATLLEIKIMTDGYNVTASHRASVIIQRSLLNYSGSYALEFRDNLFGEINLRCLFPQQGPEGPNIAIKTIENFLKRFKGHKPLIIITHGPCFLSQAWKTNVIHGDLSTRSHILSTIETPSIICDSPTAQLLQKTHNPTPLTTIDTRDTQTTAYSIDLQLPLKDRHSLARRGSMQAAISSTLKVNVGYAKEKERTVQVVNGWMQDQKMRTIVLEGLSGVGKSTLMNYIVEVVRKKEVEECITRISKEEISSPLKSITHLVQYMVTTFAKETYIDIKTRPRHSSISYARTASLKRPNNQPPAFVKAPQEKNETNLSEEDIGIYLIRMNEDPGMAPLMSAFFPEIHFKSTETTKNLPMGVGNRLLALLIGRLIGRWTVNRRLLVVFDDVQWMDPSSLEVVKYLIKNRPEQLLLLLCTRPTQNLDYNTMAATSPPETFLHLPLTGLKKEDIGEYLHSDFQDDFISSVHENVISQLFEVADTLLEQHISENILGQFKRLHPDFQSFLTCACILGQYFDLDDVLLLMFVLHPLRNFTPSILRDLIDREDAYSYVIFQESTNEDDEIMFFRHISIAAAIYDSIPDDLRLTLHDAAGNVLEKRIEAGITGAAKRMVLLPQVYHHFSCSGNLEKKLEYGEELGIYYEQRSFNKESAIILIEFIEFFETLQEVPSSYQNPSRQLRWYCTLAKAAISCNMMTAVTKSAIKALSIAGIHLPNPDTVSLSMVRKTGLRHFILFLRTKGGKRALMMGAKKKPKVEPASMHKETKRKMDDNDLKRGLTLRWRKNLKSGMQDESERSKIINSCLICLVQAAGNAEILSPKFILLCLFEVLNYNIVRAHEYPGPWAVSALAASFVLANASRKLMETYFKAAQHVVEQYGHQEVTSGFILYVALLRVTGRPDLENIEKASGSFQSIFERAGDVSNWQAARNLRMYVKYPKSADEVRDMFMQRLDRATEIDTLYHQTMWFLLECSLTLKDPELIAFAMKELEALRRRISFHMGKYPPKSTFPETTGLVWQAVFRKDITEAVINLKNLRDRIRPKLPPTFLNPAAIFGLYAAWPLATFMEHETNPNQFQNTKEDILSVLVKGRDLYPPILVDKDDISPLILESAIELYSGKRTKATKHLQTVLDPKKKMHRWRKVSDPVFYGVANAAMWLLTGKSVFYDESVTRFREIDGKCWLEWLEECSAPLSSKWDS
ncbi:hypothetical protein HDU97_002881 [Phlyctochytrium planicorne]|nr:hypothetical protein HDU97_002881 [Phlyctochytrium planicorne]